MLIKYILSFLVFMLNIFREYKFLCLIHVYLFGARFHLSVNITKKFPTWNFDCNLKSYLN